MASLLSWVGRAGRDLVDANTADDRKRRLAQGRPALYQQPRALTALGQVARELPTTLPRMNPVTAPQLLIPDRFKTDATEGVDKAFDALNRTPIGQNRVIKFTSDNLVRPVIKSGARVSDVQTGQDRYAPGLKGVAEVGTDAANIGSIIYAPAKAGILAKGGMPALKVAPEAFARGAGAGASINLLNQAAEKGVGNLDLKQAALAAGIGGVANVALPAGIGKAGRTIENRVPLNEAGYIRLSDGKSITPPRRVTADQYGMSHRPTEGPPAHDLLAKVNNDGFSPKDIYDHPDWYGASPKSAETIKKIKGNPDAEITVYRAGPKNELNKGDWVSFDKDYAATHVRETGEKVHEFKIKASEARFAGDSLDEFGFFPTKTRITTPLNEIGAVGKNVGGPDVPKKTTKTDLTKYTQQEITADAKRVSDRMAVLNEALEKYPNNPKATPAQGEAIVANRKAYLEEAAQGFNKKYGTSFKSYEDMQTKLGHFGDKPETDIGTELLYKQLDQQKTPSVPKDIKTRTIKTVEGKTEYVAQLGNTVRDKVGRDKGFKANTTSPQFKSEGEMNKWISQTIEKQDLNVKPQSGGTLRPDKVPEPYKNNVWQGEISPERLKSTQANVDEMKAFIKSGKSKYATETPAPKAKKKVPTGMSRQDFNTEAMRVRDNLKAGEKGYVKDGDKTFEISRDSKRAKPVTAPATKLPPPTKSPITGEPVVKLPVAPKPATSKTRGFTKNMAKANATEGNPTAQAVIDSMPGYKPITNKNTLGRAAKAINENPTQVYADIATKKQLTSADDVAKGNLLLRSAIESGDTEAAIQIGTKMGVDGTKLGQAVQAYSMFKKTTPEGIVQLASKKASKAGKELDPAITKELITQAKAIQKMPESLEKAKATQALLGEADKIDRTWKNTVQEVISSPRSMMATADLSAPLRQGAVLGSRYPKQFAKNFGESVKYFFKPGAYEQAMYDISQRPTYGLMKSHKLAVDGAKGMTGTEEQFMKSILEGPNAKKIGIGHVVAASDRAYTGFLTKLRADVFDHVVTQSEKAGVKLDNKALDSLGKFINSASGRGSGKNLDKYGGLLSQALFSPKLWKSRIDTLNPAYYARLDPAARKVALQSAASFSAITGTILGLAAAAGADVETDPRSADFAKVKVGNTRYDILGGHQQQARFAAQMISGQKINSETGELQTLGPDRGFGKPSRLDLAYQFVENKENPVIGFATKALRGTDAAGNKLNLATEAAKLGIPLNIQGAYETGVDQGNFIKGAAMNLPGTFGIGVQTYGKNKTKDKATATNGATDGSGLTGAAVTKADFEAKGKNGSVVQLDDGKYAVKQGDKVETADNLKDIYTKINKKELNESGMAYKVVGDTVYRQNKDGDVSATPKIQFDNQINTATLTQQKRNEDYDGWTKTAEKQLENINEQLKDPSLDPLEAIKLQNQADSLVEQYEKYASYGGAFKKGKSGSGGGRAGGGRSNSVIASSFKTAGKGGVAKPKTVSVKKLSPGKLQKTRKLSVAKLPQVRG